MGVSKFTISPHAKERIVERGMTDPNALEKALRIAKRSARKKIIESCPRAGFKQECIYWITHTNPMPVYVTKCIDINKYIVVTAFVIQK